LKDSNRLGLIERATGLGMILLLAAGCSGERINYTRLYVDYPADYVAYESGTPYLRTFVVGNPFRVAVADIEDAVVAALEKTPHTYGLKFTTDPTVETRPNAYMSVVLGGAETINVRTLCTSALGEFPEPDVRPIPVHAALCYNRSPLSAASGSLSDVEDPSDPRFEGIIRTMAQSLLQTVPQGGVSNSPSGP